MIRPIYIASSPWFIVLAGAMYLGVAGALLLSNWPWWLCLGMLLVLAIDYKRVVCQYGLRTHKSAVSILCQDCDKLIYELLSGKCYIGKLVKDRSFCSSLVLVLYVKHLVGGRYIVIPRDALSKHNYRLLAFNLSAAY